MFRSLHLIALLVLMRFGAVLAEQAQYCLHGSGGKPDFCMATFLYHNHTTSSHDLYLTLEAKRSKGSPSGGWTAIGTGSTMQDALMFVLYGDAKDEAKAPTLSVRTVSHGHTPPRVLSDKDDIQVQVLNSSWTSSGEDFIGTASAICYNCAEWHGNAISTKSTSQPWIYAFNTDQDLSPYSHDEELRSHGHNGMGVFYIDMTSATTHHATSPPAINNTMTQNHASDKPIASTAPGLGSRIAARPIAYLHGLFMCIAFLVLFPAGVVAIRSGSPNSFRYHWSIQAAAMITVLCGAGMGIYLSGSDIFGSAHTIVGATVSSLAVTQIGSGWWHHVKFVQIRQRTYISYVHMTVGWTVLVGGWTNVLLGLALFGVGLLSRVLVGVFIAVETIALVGWVYIARKRARHPNSSKLGKHVAWEDAGEEYFALHDNISDSEDEELEDQRRAEEKPLSGQTDR